MEGEIPTPALRVELVPLASIAPAKRNPKLHALGDLRASVARFGFRLPPMRDEGTGRLVAGHGRVELLALLKSEGRPPPENVGVDPATGDWLVPVLCGLAFRDEGEAEAYLVADNRQVELGGWDEGVVNAMLAEIREGTDGLAGTGFTDAQLQAMVVAATHTARAPVLGLNLAEQFDKTYAAGLIKQIVIHLKGEEYDDVVARMAAAMDRVGADNHTDLLLRLLEEHEKARPPVA